jgi:hypothetical protein
VKGYEALEGQHGRIFKAITFLNLFHRYHAPTHVDPMWLAWSLGRCAIVLSVDGEEGQVIAALLLDVARSDRATHVLAEIEALFGAQVGAPLSACLRSSYRTQITARAGRSTLAEKLACDLAGAEHVALADCIVMAIELHGQLIRSGQRVWRDNDDREAVLHHFEVLAEAFKMIYSGPLAEQFAAIVTDISALASPYSTQSGLPQDDGVPLRLIYKTPKEEE